MFPNCNITSLSLQLLGLNIFCLSFSNHKFCKYQLSSLSSVLLQTPTISARGLFSISISLVPFSMKHESAVWQLWNVYHWFPVSYTINFALGILSSDHSVCTSLFSQWTYGPTFLPGTNIVSQHFNCNGWWKNPREETLRRRPVYHHFYHHVTLCI